MMARRYLISQHSEVQRKIEAELDSLGFLVTSTRKTPRRLEYSDLSKLPYLSGAIKASQPSALKPDLCSAPCLMNLPELFGQVRWREGLVLRAGAALAALYACQDIRQSDETLIDLSSGDPLIMQRSVQAGYHQERNVQESMRMMAVVGTGIGRVVNGELQLALHIIPKGNYLCASLTHMLMTPFLRLTGM